MLAVETAVLTGSNAGSGDPVVCSERCTVVGLTACSRVLLEKLTVPQLVKKFPAFYGTRRFITAFTSAGHLSLS